MSEQEKAEFLFTDLIKSISDRIRLDAVILFGSRAKGTAHQFSDYDLVIIGDFTEAYRDRL